MLAFFHTTDVGVPPAENPAGKQVLTAHDRPKIAIGCCCPYSCYSDQHTPKSAPLKFKIDADGFTILRRVMLGFKIAAASG